MRLNSPKLELGWDVDNSNVRNTNLSDSIRDNTKRTDHTRKEKKAYQENMIIQNDMVRRLEDIRPIPGPKTFQGSSKGTNPYVQHTRF